MVRQMLAPERGQGDARSDAGLDATGDETSIVGLLPDRQPRA
jgi:hypothetical protein